MNPATITVDVPRTFYEDHTARDCGSTGKVVKVLARKVRVCLDATALADLLSDAVYYSDAASSMGPEYIGLQASARATVRALDK